MSFAATVAVDGPVAPIRAVWSARFGALSERGTLQLQRAKIEPAGDEAVSLDIVVTLMEPCSVASQARVEAIVRRAVTHSGHIAIHVADHAAAKAAAVRLRASDEPDDVDTVSVPGALIVHGMSADGVRRVLGTTLYTQPDPNGVKVWLPEARGLDGTQIAGAVATQGPAGTPAVKVQFTDAGGLALAALTSRSLGGMMLLEVDGALMMAAKIAQRINEGSLMFALGSGATSDDAETLAAMLDGGALPSPVQVTTLAATCRDLPR